MPLAHLTDPEKRVANENVESDLKWLLGSHDVDEDTQTALYHVKVKKMKKGVQAVMAANAAAAMAAGPEPEPEPEVSENPLAGAGVDPDIEPTLDADIETVVPAAKPRRKKKKKTIAA